MLEVLVCTFGDRARSMFMRMPAPEPDVAWLICHQDPLGEAVRPAELPGRADVRYLRFSDRGLARNRNHALRHARGRICLIADDDIAFVPGWTRTILSAFDAQPDAAFVSLVLVDGDGRPHRRYPHRPTRHDARSVFSVVSCELAFDLDRIRATGVGFSEHLGLGTRIGRGEEGVFLRDVLANGASGWAIAAPIARHDGPTTGDRAMAALGRREVEGLGAVSYCKWGALAVAMAAKETLRLSLRVGSIARAPEIGFAFIRGVFEARRLGLGKPTTLGSS
jgi:hypothetical protein